MSFHKVTPVKKARKPQPQKPAPKKAAKPAPKKAPSRRPVGNR